MAETRECDCCFVTGRSANVVPGMQLLTFSIARPRSRTTYAAYSQTARFQLTVTLNTIPAPWWGSQYPSYTPGTSKTLLTVSPGAFK